MKAPEEHLIEALSEIDVVISCVGPAEQQDQIPLAKAAKRAGVKRFIPCGFITVAPPGGVMWLRDEVRQSMKGEKKRHLVVQMSYQRTNQVVFLPNRKKSSTTRSANFGFRTPSSMSAGGTSFLTPASLPDVSIMP